MKPIRALNAAVVILAISPAIPGQTDSRTPLSLEEAVAKAMVANPQIDIAKSQTREASASAQRARAGMLPRVGVAESFTESTDPVFAFGARLRQGRFGAADFSPNRLNFPPPTGDYSSSASAAWTVFDGLRSLNATRAARKSAEASQQEMAATRQSIASVVISAYFRALLSDEEKSAIATAVARAEAFARQTHDRVDTGLALKSDGMQADVEVAQEQQHASEAEANQAVAYADLAGIVGDPRAIYELAPRAGTPSESSQDLNALQEAALKARPDVAAAKRQIEAAQLALTAAHGAYSPQVSTFGNVEADNPHLLGGGNNNWTVGAKIELPVFDGGVRRAEVEKSKAQLEAAQASYRQIEARTFVEVKKAFYERQTAERQYSTSAEMLRQAQETLRTAKDRYGAGLLTLTEVLRQQEQLRDIEIGRAQSLYRWWIADAQLRLATGTLNLDAGGRF